MIKLLLIGVVSAFIPFEVLAQELPKFQCRSDDDGRSCVERFQEARGKRDYSPELVIRFVVDRLLDGRSKAEVRARAPVEKSFLFFRWHDSEKPVDRFDDYIALSNAVSLSVAYLEVEGVSAQLETVLGIWHGYTPYTTFVDTLSANIDNCEANRRAQQFLAKIVESGRLDASLKIDLNTLREHLVDRYESKCN